MRPTWLVLGVIVAAGTVAYLKLRSDDEPAPTPAAGPPTTPAGDPAKPVALQRPAEPAAGAAAAEPAPASADASEEAARRILQEMAEARARGDSAAFARGMETLQKEAWDAPSSREFAVRAGFNLLEEAGRAEGAERIRLLDRARRYLSRGVYSPALFDEAGNPRPERTRLVEAIQKANAQVMRYGPGLPGVTDRLAVAPGLAPVQIVSRNALPYGHNALLYWNKAGDLDPTRLRAGETLLVPKEALRVEVHRRLHLLGVFLGDWFVKEFRVGVGTTETPTPAGEWVVDDKHENPVWWSKDGVIQPGDPRNELGAAWITIKNEENPRGNYGIHGTNRPETVGSDCSQGCVRLADAEVRELYYWVRRAGGGAEATRVLIR